MDLFVESADDQPETLQSPSATAAPPEAAPQSDTGRSRGRGVASGRGNPRGDSAKASSGTARTKCAPGGECHEAKTK